jgi:hypothetical protein
MVESRNHQWHNDSQEWLGFLGPTAPAATEPFQWSARIIK